MALLPRAGTRRALCGPSALVDARASVALPMIYWRWVLLILLPMLGVSLALLVVILYMMRNRPWQ